MRLDHLIEMVLTVVLFIAASMVRLYLDYTDPKIDPPSP